MVRLLWIIVCLISLAIALMCGLAAVTVLAAIVTGKLTDPDAWKTAVFLARLGFNSTEKRLHSSRSPTDPEECIENATGA